MAANRVFNFSAGPATLPADVLIQAREELLDWGGQGMSVMEMSHRSPEVVGVAQRAEQNLQLVESSIGHLKSPPKGSAAKLAKMRLDQAFGDLEPAGAQLDRQVDGAVEIVEDDVRDGQPISDAARQRVLRQKGLARYKQERYDEAIAILGTMSVPPPFGASTAQVSNQVQARLALHQFEGFHKVGLVDFFDLHRP